MKPIFTKSFLAVLFLGLISITACNNDDDGDNDCTGHLHASWKVNGVLEESYQGWHITTTSLLGLTFKSCDDENKSIIISYIPSPPAVGTYQLKYGPGSPITQVGTYNLGDANIDYHTTDSIDGTLVITEVNTTDKTLSGTFSFDAVKDDGSGEIISITEGQIFNTVYED